MYVKDISQKIKATLNSQKRNGKFMGGVAPYGYDRNLPYDKHELIIKEYLIYLLVVWGLKR